MHPEDEPLGCQLQKQELMELFSEKHKELNCFLTTFFLPHKIKGYSLIPPLILKINTLLTYPYLVILTS